jgi:C-terminal processing protease CtpA/Prc
VIARCLPLLLLPACSFTEGKLATERPPLRDMVEPLALHKEPDDEAQRGALPAGGFTGVVAADARRTLDEMEAAPAGIVVERVVENSPADFAGLLEGDLLLEAGGAPLRWVSEWRDLELRSAPGAVIRVAYDRAGTRREAAIRVAERVRPAGREEARRFREEERVGVVVRTATEVEARGHGLGPGGGAVIVGLSAGSPWRKAGLLYGDLVVAAGGQPVAHPDVLLAAIRQAPEGGSVSLRYVREGRTHDVEAPVSRRAGEITRVRIPLLYSYEKSRGEKRVSVLLGIYKRVSTPAAWETRLLWIFKLRGGDADRLEEVEE